MPSRQGEWVIRETADVKCEKATHDSFGCRRLAAGAARLTFLVSWQAP